MNHANSKIHIALTGVGEFSIDGISGNFATCLIIISDFAACSNQPKIRIKDKQEKCDGDH